jgi:hypothetical protein
MASVQKVTVILDGTNTWHDWLEVVKTKARAGKIWEYIDPSLSVDEVRKLVEPKMPEASDVEEGAESPTDLTDNDLKKLRELQQAVKPKLREFELKERALNEMVKHIQETVSSTYLSWTYDCNTVYDMLVALQMRLKPKKDVRRMELINRLIKLRDNPKTRQVDEWLQEYEKTYREGVKEEIPDFNSEYVVQGFLQATSKLNPEFATYFQMTLIRHPQEKPDLYELVDAFRHHRAQMTVKKGATHGAFTSGGVTLQGQPEAKPATQNTEEKKKNDDCICGGKHRFKECPYLVESVQPKGWTADPEITKRVSQKLKEHKKLKNAVKHCCGKDAIPFRKAEAAELAAGESEGEQENANKIRHAGFALSGVFNATSTSADYPLRDSILLDSASDLHICNDLSRAIGPIRPSEEGQSVICGSDALPIEGWGEIEVTVKIPGSKKDLITLNNVAFIPRLQTSVASFYLMHKKGVEWDTGRGVLTWKNMDLCSVECHHRQWVLEYNPLPPNTNDAVFALKSTAPRVATASSDLWHERLAHCGPEVIEHLPTSMTGAKVTAGPSANECTTCGVGKAHKLISRRATRRADSPFERVHWDLISMKEGYNGDKYVSHFLDDRTRMSFVYTMPRKSMAFSNILQFVAYVERRWDRKVKILHMDHERALGNKFQNWVGTQGITVEPSAVYTPEQNGSAESSGKWLIIKARCMRIEANLPESLWPKIVSAAGYLMNRTPRKSSGWKSPWQDLQECLGLTVHQPDISHLKVYGCKAYALIPPQKIPRKDKLAPRAEIGWLVGYQSTNIYEIWIPQPFKIIQSRDVTFDERTKFDPSQLTTIPVSVPTVINIPEMVYEDLADAALSDELEANIEDEESVSETPLEKNTPLNRPASTPNPPWPTPDATPDPPSPPPLPDPTPELSQRPRPSREIFGEVGAVNLAEGTRIRKASTRRQEYEESLKRRDDHAALHATYAAALRLPDPRAHRDQLPPPPRNWKEAQKHPRRDGFVAAAQREYQALEAKGTFREVSRPIDTKVIPLTWVFTYKFDADGYLITEKARICVRGDLQPFMSDEDSYAATLKLKTGRFCFAIMARFDLDDCHLDIKNAFVNSVLDELVYCEFPDGFGSGKRGCCLLLHRALYGLRRSPKLWQEEFSRALQELGLRPVGGEPCLFTDGDGILIFFYVDDIILLSRKERAKQAAKLKTDLMARYEMRDLGPVQWFLGIRVTRDREKCKVYLCQDSYIDQVAHRYHLTNRKAPTTTPETTELCEPDWLGGYLVFDWLLRLEHWREWKDLSEFQSCCLAILLSFSILIH